MGVKISKRFSSYGYDSFSAKLFLNVNCDSHNKGFPLGFSKSFFFSKKTECFHFGQ